MILAHNVTKVFQIPHRTRRTLFHRLFPAVHVGYDYEELYALRDISFQIRKNEFVGIAGRNGSGKTTLLRVLAGIYRPTTGYCQLDGPVAPMLEIGVGFQMRFNCKENVFLYGALLGFTKREIESRYRDIMQFAELVKFADTPLEYLSAGMRVRLAFSIAIQSRAPIILVDEVLAVGDLVFQQKCREVFRQFKREGRTLVFVSHDLGALREFCDRVIILDGGSLVADVSPANLEKTYRQILLQSNNETKRPDIFSPSFSQQRVHNGH